MKAPGRERSGANLVGLGGGEADRVERARVEARQWFGEESQFPV